MLYDCIKKLCNYKLQVQCCTCVRLSTNSIDYSVKNTANIYVNEYFTKCFKFYITIYQNKL